MKQFHLAEDLYTALIDGPDLYNMITQTLAFHYNGDGAIAYYRLNIEDAIDIAEKMEPGDEILSGYLGPGGWIIDVDDNGDPKPCLEWLENEYKGIWVTPSELTRGGRYE